MIEAFRPHETEASCRAIAGTFFIDMFAPETFRAMVSIRAVRKRLHLPSAMLTHKRFLARDEDHELTLP